MLHRVCPCDTIWLDTLPPPPARLPRKRPSDCRLCRADRHCGRCLFMGKRRTDGFAVTINDRRAPETELTQFLSESHIRIYATQFGSETIKRNTHHMPTLNVLQYVL